MVGEGGSEVVFAAVAALSVAGAVEESVGVGSAVAAGEAVIAFEYRAVPVAFGVEVHGSAAPPARGAVGVACLEAFDLESVFVAEAAEFRV